MWEVVVNIHIVDGSVAPKFVGKVGSCEGCPDSIGDGVHSVVVFQPCSPGTVDGSKWFA